MNKASKSSKQKERMFFHTNGGAGRSSPILLFRYYDFHPQKLVYNPLDILSLFLSSF